jgi:hypothetical protein
MGSKRFALEFTRSKRVDKSANRVSYDRMAEVPSQEVQLVFKGIAHVFLFERSVRWRDRSQAFDLGEYKMCQRLGSRKPDINFACNAS